MGSSSEISSTTSSEVAPFITPSISINTDFIPLVTSEESGPPPRLQEWGGPGEERVSEMIPSVAHSPVSTQSPEAVADADPESPTNSQSDSSSESYNRVSAGDKFGAGAEMFIATQETCSLFQSKKKIVLKHIRSAI